MRTQFRKAPDSEGGNLRRPTKLRIIAALFWVFVLGTTVFRFYTARGVAEAADPAPNQIFLPLVWASDRFHAVPAIWAPGTTDSQHQVVLFRYSFSLHQPVSQSALHIFADTRYEAWLDGNWLGRGPARFARLQREYDEHQTGDLAAGEHVLAILAQWAPNIRRSESLTPLLKARLVERPSGGWNLIAISGTDWKALTADAWQSSAALVHSWHLIGPTELLDYRLLPADWRSEGFDDSAWTNAQIVDELALLSPEQAAQGISYQLRSIPLLQEYSIPVQLLDRGRLSPDLQIVELGPFQQPALTFRLLQDTTFALETLSGGYAPAPDGIFLDDQALSWAAAGASRPDVMTTQRWLVAGWHTLHMPDTGQWGMTLGLSRENLADLALSGGASALFQQGLHAGRRLLLAEPQSDSAAVLVSGSQALTLTFVTQPAYVILDLGRTVHGRLVADVQGPAGVVIDIGWDERLLAGTSRPLPFPGSQHVEWNQVDSWILDGAVRELTTIDSRAGRYVEIAVWGLESGWGSEPVHISNLQILEERYPQEQMGSFLSDDPRLNAIWQLGVETLYPNMTDGYTDTPWRERGQWWGDAHVAGLVNRQAFGDELLRQRGLKMMAIAFQDASAPAAAPNNYAPNMLDYSMLWVLDLADYSQLTGDRQILSRLYPTVKNFMQHLAGYKHAETGLMDIPYGPWWLTGYIDTRGYINRYGQSTAQNALYVAVLQQAAWIASQVDDGTSSQAWYEQAEQVRSAIHQYLFVPVENRYLAHIYLGEPDTYPVSPHAQAWALAYGVVPEADQQAVADALLAALSDDPANPNLDVYGMYWVLKALGEVGRQADALEVIDLYYGRLLDLGASTWWERFDANCCFNSSLSHSWGGSPTWFLTTFVLGVQQTGAKAWQINLNDVLLSAQQTDLQQVSGSLPVAGEVVEAAWQTNGCLAGVQNIRVQLRSPLGLAASAVWPELTGSQFYLNGVLQDFSDPAGSQKPILSLAGGLNTLEFEFACQSGE